MATRKSKKAYPKAKPATKLRALAGGRPATATSSKEKKTSTRGSKSSQSSEEDSKEQEVVTVTAEATDGDNLPLAVLGELIDAEEQSHENTALEDMFNLVSGIPDPSIGDEANSRLSDLDEEEPDEPTLRPPSVHEVSSFEDDAVETEDDRDQSPVMAVAGDLLEAMGDIPDTAALLRHAIEAMLFVSDKPITLKELSKGLQLDKKRTLELLSELRVEYENRGIRIDEVADGYAFRTHPSIAEYVRNFLEQRPVKLSRAQLETLSIVAYRQPITRPEVDDIRGVDCGPVLKGLLERDLVRILGKKDEPGRPMLYGTTPAFLELFGLKSLQELPTLREFAELNEDSKRKYEEEIGEGPPIGLADLGLIPDSADSNAIGGLGSQDSPIAMGHELAGSDQDGETAGSEANPAKESSPSRGKVEDEDEKDEEEGDDEDEDDEDEDDEEDDEDEDEDEDDEDDEEVAGDGEEDEDEDEDDEDEDDEEDEEDEEDDEDDEEEEEEEK